MTVLPSLAAGPKFGLIEFDVAVGNPSHVKSFSCYWACNLWCNFILALDNDVTSACNLEHVIFNCDIWIASFWDKPYWRPSQSGLQTLDSQSWSCDLASCHFSLWHLNHVVICALTQAQSESTGAEFCRGKCLESFSITIADHLPSFALWPSSHFKFSWFS